MLQTISDVKQHVKEYTPYNDWMLLRADEVSDELLEWRDAAEASGNEAEIAAVRSVIWATGAWNEDEEYGDKYIENSEFEWRRAKELGW